MLGGRASAEDGCRIGAYPPKRLVQMGSQPSERLNGVKTAFEGGGGHWEPDINDSDLSELDDEDG